VDSVATVKLSTMTFVNAARVVESGPLPGSGVFSSGEETGAAWSVARSAGHSELNAANPIGAVAECHA
jgi:hypothetical protein